jgi:hypothetical protein
MIVSNPNSIYQIEEEIAGEIEETKHRKISLSENRA